MTLRCIDIETTGTDPAKDAIVEIASVDLQRDNTITNQQGALVRPGIPVPPEASAVHTAELSHDPTRPETRSHSKRQSRLVGPATPQLTTCFGQNVSSVIFASAASPA